jgi:hypothetical protein
MESKNIYCDKHKKESKERFRNDNSYFKWLKVKDIKCPECKKEALLGE